MFKEGLVNFEIKMARPGIPIELPRRRRVPDVVYPAPKGVPLLPIRIPVEPVTTPREPVPVRR